MSRALSLSAFALLAAAAAPAAAQNPGWGPSSPPTLNAGAPSPGSRFNPAASVPDDSIRPALQQPGFNAVLGVPDDSIRPILQPPGARR